MFWKKKKDTDLKCSECNKSFSITSIEKTFYLQKGLGFPSICRVCKANPSSKDEALPNVVNK